MSHTILLVQPTRSAASRTYSDYESQNQAMEGVCKMFETHLKEMFPTQPQISYDVSDLYAFIDALGDLSCLVFNGGSRTYVPHDKEWIKQKVFQLLRQQLA